MDESAGVSVYPIAILIGTVMLGLAAAYIAWQRHKRKARGGASRRE